MVTRSNRLEIVLELAERNERKAADVYEAAKRAWQTDEAKLEELRVYYSEYEQSFSGNNVMRASDMARQRDFLQKLSDAIVQQGEVVTHRFELAETKKGLWHKAHMKYAALRDLIQRMRADEQRVLSRREEKMLDEWFTQSSIRRNLEQEQSGARL